MPVLERTFLRTDVKNDTSGLTVSMFDDPGLGLANGEHGRAQSMLHFAQLLWQYAHIMSQHYYGDIRLAVMSGIDSGPGFRTFRR